MFIYTHTHVIPSYSQGGKNEMQQKVALATCKIFKETNALYVFPLSQVNLDFLNLLAVAANLLSFPSLKQWM